MFCNCDNNVTVILDGVFVSPIELCPNLGFNKDAGIYHYQLSSDRDVTMNCTEDAANLDERRCRVNYSFPLLGTGESCDSSSDCESGDCGYYREGLGNR